MGTFGYFGCVFDVSPRLLPTDCKYRSRKYGYVVTTPSEGGIRWFIPVSGSAICTDVLVLPMATWEMDP